MDNERAMVLYEEGRGVIWCHAAEAFGGGDVVLKTDDVRLKGQLVTPTYELRNGKILIEAKSEIKKRLGNSPDRADAYVNGLYALQFVDGQLIGGRRDRYADDFDDDFEDWPCSGRHTAMGM